MVIELGPGMARAFGFVCHGTGGDVTEAVRRVGVVGGVGCVQPAISA